MAASRSLVNDSATKPPAMCVNDRRFRLTSSSWTTLGAWQAKNSLPRAARGLRQETEKLLDGDEGKRPVLHRA
jgi:hypothetical protein